MVFSSITFLFYFFPIFFFLYYLADVKYKNVIILVGSIVFYAWGAPKFVFVILGTTIFDFFAVRLMAKQQKRNVRSLLLVCSLLINLGLLAYFKYSNFFVENLNYILQKAGITELRWIQLILPIGISFYTFETITYVVDVYRGVHKPLRNFWDYQLYIILFPKLIAGPIIRFHDFADQVYDHVHYETMDNKLQGFFRFSLGLGKKVLIANVMGANADVIFGIPSSELGTTTAWLGALSYAFQIYFDFSGYSDMAIGLGLMMGFRFPENFDNPYSASSVTDFWRKWHITLGTWMRNYLYIPLGGNKVDKQWRIYVNLSIVFLASGLWHGAAWGFMIWGAYHGFFLIVERVFLGAWLKKAGRFACFYTFPVVVVGWVFFRTEQIGTSIAYLSSMFRYKPSSNVWVPGKEFAVFLFLSLFFSFFTFFKLGRAIQTIVYSTTHSSKPYIALAMLSLTLFIISAGRITTSTFNPFIYFRF